MVCAFLFGAVFPETRLESSAAAMRPSLLPLLAGYEPKVSQIRIARYSSARLSIFPLGHGHSTGWRYISGLSYKEQHLSPTPVLDPRLFPSSTLPSVRPTIMNAQVCHSLWRGYVCLIRVIPDLYVPPG